MKLYLNGLIEHHYHPHKAKRRFDKLKLLLSPGWGTRKNFDRDARVTFLGLNLIICYFLRLLKMRVIFCGLKN